MFYNSKKTNKIFIFIASASFVFDFNGGVFVKRSAIHGAPIYLAKTELKVIKERWPALRCLIVRTKRVN